MKSALKVSVAALLLTAVTLLSATGAHAVDPAPDPQIDGAPNPLVQGPPKTRDVIPAKKPPAGGSPTIQSLAYVAGDIKVTLVTVQTADRSAGDAAAINLDAARNSIASANSYWNILSNGRLSISVSNTVTGFKTSARSDQNFDTVLDTVTRELGWVANPYSALVIYMPRNDVVVDGSGGNLGAGWDAGNASGRILMPYTSGFTNPVIAHEFGHVLGLMHANSLECSNGAQDSAIVNGAMADSSCRSREYGDTTDLMGATQYAQPFINSVLFDYLGMGRGDEIFNAGVARDTKTYTLKAWAGWESNRAVKFTDAVTGETYYLQLRLPVGFDSSTAYNGNRGVEILKGDPQVGASLLIPPSTLPFAGYYNKNHAWQAGGKFTTAGGRSTVTIDSITGDSATVTVHGDTTYWLVPQFNDAAMRGNLGSSVGPIWDGLRDGGAYQLFQRGYVVYSPATGAHPSTGAIRGDYQSTGFENGVLGYPTTDEVSGLKDGGVYQGYQGGVIVWSPASGAHTSMGAIRGTYQSSGFENGLLGYPTTDEIGGLKNGGVYQMYQGGAIVWSPLTGAFISNGGIRSMYQSTGFENGFLGYPTTNEYKTAGGVAQEYQGGKIAYSAATGAHALKGAISGKYFSLGGYSSALGYPTSNETGGLKNGGAIQTFEHGSLIWSPATLAHMSSGAINLAWIKSGGQNSVIGYPTTDEISGLKDGGSYQMYQNGAIVKSAAGAFISTGSIRAFYMSKGFENGVLGYPTTNEYATADGKVAQDYQGGRVIWAPATGASMQAL